MLLGDVGDALSRQEEGAEGSQKLNQSGLGQ